MVVGVRHTAYTACNNDGSKPYSEVPVARKVAGDRAVGPKTQTQVKNIRPLPEKGLGPILRNLAITRVS